MLLWLSVFAAIAFSFTFSNKGLLKMKGINMICQSTKFFALKFDFSKDRLLNHTKSFLHVCDYQTYYAIILYHCTILYQASCLINTSWKIKTSMEYDLHQLYCLWYLLLFLCRFSIMTVYKHNLSNYVTINSMWSCKLIYDNSLSW